jgi:hypothetical protein
VPAPALGAQSFTIRTSDGSVARIGSFQLRKDPSLAAATRVFGAPSSAKSVYGASGCNVTWRKFRLKIQFANFGGSSACNPSFGLAQSFSVRSSRFRSWEGVRPGQRSSSIPRKHKAAIFRSGAWWLRTAISPFGEGEEYAVVSAITRDGRVTALKGWIGSAGE